MADLSTTYLGFTLAHPIMPGASPMVDDLNVVRMLEDSGASMIVMHSLFEEQIRGEQVGTHLHMDSHADSFGEALSFFPSPAEYRLGPYEYLEQIREMKKRIRIPVVGSLNGITEGGWLEYAKLIQQAGADALELNMYTVATHLDESALMIEDRSISVLKAVRQAVSIPIAVKLSPYFSSLPNYAKRLEEAGANGIILFNRFYQPDILPEELEIKNMMKLSDSSELPLRLCWLALLSGRVKPSLGVTGGVHTAQDAVKAIMAGAHGVQMVSALLRNGPGYLSQIIRDLSDWLEKNEYDSIRQMQGNMSLLRCPDPEAYQRGNYVHMLQSFRL